MITLDTVRKKLDGMPKVRTKKRRADFPTLQSLLDFLLTRDSKYQLPETIYLNKKGTQCPCVKYGRGFGDLYSIVRYYFPKITLEELLAHFRNDAHSGKQQSSYFIQFCKSTNQHVVRSQAAYPYTDNKLSFCIEDKKYTIDWSELDKKDKK